MACGGWTGSGSIGRSWRGSAPCTDCPFSWSSSTSGLGNSGSPLSSLLRQSTSLNGASSAQRQPERTNCSSIAREGSRSASRCAVVQLPPGSGDTASRTSSHPGSTSDANGRPSNWLNGRITTSSCRVDSGTKLAASSVSLTHALKPARLKRRAACGSCSNSNCAPSASRSAAITLSPAASPSSRLHWPVACSSVRSAASHCASGLLPCRPCCQPRTCSTSAASDSLCARSCVDRPDQSRTPARRTRRSSASTLPDASAGEFFSQSSTASLDAFQALARRAAIRCAAARVVESFQPVSSRITTPRPSSMARICRVSTRSMAPSATGTRPASICRITQAAACSASSAGSLAQCRVTCPAALPTSSVSETALSPASNLSVSTSGSTSKPCSATSRSKLAAASGRSRLSAA